MITFSANKTQVGVPFTLFVEQVTSRRLIPQYNEDNTAYTLYAFDGEIVFVCVIWKGDVPSGVVASGYTQEQNDADKASFLGGYAATCNSSLVPKGSDGTPASLPCLFPNGVYVYLAGAGDSDTERGAGTPFAVASDTSGNTLTEWSYLDWVLIAGGGAIFSGAEVGDYLTQEVVAPATSVTPNGTGTGNCNLVDPGVGAAILIVPAAGDGAYDVDLAAAIPVPAWNPVTGVCSGFYEWDKPNTGKGTISVGAPGQSHFYLLTVEKVLIRFVNKMPLVGAGSYDFNIPAVEPKVMMPHWKGRVTLHNAGHAGLKAAWYLTTARMQTV